MKTLYFILIIATGCAVVSANVKCDLTPPVFTKAWIDMKDGCTQAMIDQIREELKASMQYLAMGAHFATDHMNRPGFSKFFFDSATEEREHATKLINYLLMRGKLTSDIRKLVTDEIKPAGTSWKNGELALNAALELEVAVTRNIRNLIQVCEGTAKSKSELAVDPQPNPDKPVDDSWNDYHLVDYLTGEFLEEQLKGQRHLAGLISTLGKMKGKHGNLGEFLFDKKLLKGEIL